VHEAGIGAGNDLWSLAVLDGVLTCAVSRRSQMIYFVFAVSVLAQSVQNGALLKLTGEAAKVEFGGALTLIHNSTDDKLVCSGKIQASDVVIDGSATTVADLMSEFDAMKTRMAALEQFVGWRPPMSPPPMSPPPMLPPPMLPPSTTPTTPPPTTPPSTPSQNGCNSDSFANCISSAYIPSCCLGGCASSYLACWMCTVPGGGGGAACFDSSRIASCSATHCTRRQLLNINDVDLHGNGTDDISNINAVSDKAVAEP